MDQGLRAGIRSASRLIAAALIVLTSAPGASSHPFFFDDIVVALVRADAIEGQADAVALEMHVVNSTSYAATLRSLSSPAATRVALERRRLLFFIYEIWQPVDFLRLEPGEVVFLGPPDYRMIAWTPTPDAMTGPGVYVRADFGPLGVFESLDVR